MFRTFYDNQIIYSSRTFNTIVTFYDNQFRYSSRNFNTIVTFSNNNPNPKKENVIAVKSPKPTPKTKYTKAFLPLKRE